MIRKIAQYKVKLRQLDEVKRATKEYVAAVAVFEPATEYHAYVMEDGITFVHLMAFADEEAENRHRAAPHTQKFEAMIYPRCEGKPKISVLTPIP